MRAIIAITLLLSSVANAGPRRELTQEEAIQLFNGFLGFIQQQQSKKKKPPVVKNKDKEGQMVFRPKQNGDIVLAKVFLEKGHQVDTDVVKNMPRCRQSDNMSVSQVQLKVPKNAARIDKVVVRYQNGDRQRLKVRKNYTAGSQTRWIDLDGRRRCIKRIRIDGVSKGQQRAVVRILGRR